MNNNFENFLAGKDWFTTITIPNRLVMKFPHEVQDLQLRIEMELKSFNSKIKLLSQESGVAILGNEKKEVVPLTEQEKTIVQKKIEEERNKGGGGNTL